MNGNSGTSRTFDVQAVGVGALWGLAALIIAAMAQALVGQGAPLPAEAILNLLLQGTAAMLGGFAAARRAAAGGWLHGAAAGTALMLAIAVVMGVSSAFPTLAALLKMTGIGAGAGMLGGVAGVNLGRRG